MLKCLSLCVLLAVCVSAFDKRQLMKEKYTEEKHPEVFDGSLGNERSNHPISRRVLRWERSAEPLFESDFPIPNELDVMPDSLDFVKIKGNLPPKTKPSFFNNEVDYDPTLEF